MNCQMKECAAEASQALAINIPAKGYPIKEHDPIRLVIGLQLCGQCIAKAKAEEFLTADPRIKQIVCTMARGRAEPDFNRAFTSGVDFDSDEWKQLTKGRS